MDEFAPPPPSSHAIYVFDINGMDAGGAAALGSTVLTKASGASHDNHTIWVTHGCCPDNECWATASKLIDLLE